MLGVLYLNSRPGNPSDARQGGFHEISMFAVIVLNLRSWPLRITWTRFFPTSKWVTFSTFTSSIMFLLNYLNFNLLLQVLICCLESTLRPLPVNDTKFYEFACYFQNICGLGTKFNEFYSSVVAKTLALKAKKGRKQIPLLVLINYIQGVISFHSVKNTGDRE